MPDPQAWYSLVLLVLGPYPRKARHEPELRLASTGRHAVFPGVRPLRRAHAAADRPWVDAYLKHALGLEPSRIFTRSDFRLGENVVEQFEAAA